MSGQHWITELVPSSHYSIFRNSVVLKWTQKHIAISGGNPKCEIDFGDLRKLLINVEVGDRAQAQFLLACSFILKHRYSDGFFTRAIMVLNSLLYLSLYRRHLAEIGFSNENPRCPRHATLFRSPCQHNELYLKEWLACLRAVSHSQLIQAVNLEPNTVFFLSKFESGMATHGRWNSHSS